MKVLEQDQVAELCRVYPGWALDGGMLVQTYEFRDFMQAVAFVNRVAALAEALAHHPDMDIRYNRVRLALTTHDAGGISSRDATFIASMAEWSDNSSGEKRYTPKAEI